MIALLIIFAGYFACIGSLYVFAFDFWGSMTMGGIMWSVAATIILTKIWIDVPANETWIIKNNLQKQTALTEEELRSGKSPQHGLRVARTGWAFLLFALEEIANGGKIDMRKKAVEDERGKETYAEKNGQQMEVSFRCSVQVWPGYELNYYTLAQTADSGDENDRNKPNKAVADFIIGKIRSLFVEKYVLARTKDQLIGHVRECNDKFVRFIQNDPEMRAYLMEAGVFITQAEITGIFLVKSEQVAYELSAEVAAYKAAHPDVSTDYATTMVLASKGKVNMTVNRVDVNWSGDVPSNLQHLNIPGTGGSQGKGGNQGQGQKQKNQGGKPTP